ncbi:MAG: hypothetical protein ACE5GX_00560 [Thermoanaerobaculia bacterium]
MGDLQEPVGIFRVRRKLIRAAAWMVGGAVAGSLPYQRPGIRSFFGTRTAWAQASIAPIVLQGALGTGPPGSPENTGSDWWRLTVPSPGTRITIMVDDDGFLDVELFLFAPGVDPTTGTNILTNSFAPWNMAGLAGGESVTLTLGGPGHYVLAIEDSRTPRDELAGLYSITITTDQPLNGVVQIEDEKAEIQAPHPRTRRDPLNPSVPGKD